MNCNLHANKKLDFRLYLIFLFCICTYFPHYFNLVMVFVSLNIKHTSIQPCRMLHNSSITHTGQDFFYRALSPKPNTTRTPSLQPYNVNKKWMHK